MSSKRGTHPNSRRAWRINALRGRLFSSTRSIKTALSDPDVTKQEKAHLVIALQHLESTLRLLAQSRKE